MDNTKRYVRCDLSQDSELFRGYYGNLEVPLDIRVKLAKDLGFPYELYGTLFSISSEAASKMVATMSESTKHTSISLLVDNAQVLGYCLDPDRTPVLNDEFVKRVKTLVSTSDTIKISEIYHSPDDTISTIIIQKKDPIIIEEKYQGKDSVLVEYKIGVLLVNDELNSTYSRLVLYVRDQPLYLPATYYNSTSARYKRSTSDSCESLEVLVLKIIDDLREDALQPKLVDLHYRYRANKKISTTYEEYNSLMRSMRRVPTIIDDNSYLERLQEKYEAFERKYTLLEDKKSSYVWRCTALGDMSVGDLVAMTADILTELDAPSVEYFAVRELLGAYISTSRIAEEIAE